MARFKVRHLQLAEYAGRVVERSDNPALQALIHRPLEYGDRRIEQFALGAQLAKSEQSVEARHQRGTYIDLQAADLWGHSTSLMKAERRVPRLLFPAARKQIAKCPFRNESGGHDDRERDCLDDPRGKMHDS